MFQIVKRRPHTLLIVYFDVQSIVQSMAVIPPSRIILFAVQNPLENHWKTLISQSGEVEAVKVHDLVPCRYKVVHELFLGIVTCVDFR